MTPTISDTIVYSDTLLATRNGHVTFGLLYGVFALCLRYAVDFIFLLAILNHLPLSNAIKSAFKDEETTNMKPLPCAFSR